MLFTCSRANTISIPNGLTCSANCRKLRSSEGSIAP